MLSWIMGDRLIHVVQIIPLQNKKDTEKMNQKKDLERIERKCGRQGLRVWKWCEWGEKKWDWKWAVWLWELKG